MTTTLLAVDDSKTMRKVLEITFAGEDYRTVLAESSSEALAKLRAESPAIALVDAQLGQDSGYDLCQKLKREAPNVSVIILSSKQLPYDRARGSSVGADDFMDKPFDTQQLIDKVAAVLRKGPGARPQPAAAPAAAASPAAAKPAAQPAPSAFARPAPAASATPAQASAQAAGPQGAGAHGAGTQAAGTPAAFGARAPAQPAARPAPAQPPPQQARPGGGRPIPTPSSGTPAVRGSQLGPAPAGLQAGSRGQQPAARPGPAPQGAVRPPSAPMASPGPVAQTRPQPSGAHPAAVPTAAAAAAAVALDGGFEKRLAGMGLSAEQISGVLALSRDVVEKVVWEVVPVLAETLIKEEIKRLTTN